MGSIFGHHRKTTRLCGYFHSILLQISGWHSATTLLPLWCSAGFKQLRVLLQYLSANAFVQTCLVLTTDLKGAGVIRDITTARERGGLIGVFGGRKLRSLTSKGQS